MCRRPPGATLTAPLFPYTTLIRSRGAFGYVVPEYKTIDDLLRLDGPMRSDYDGIVAIMDARHTPWGDWTERHLLAAQNDQHRRMRQVLAPAFSPRQANSNRELMRPVITRVLDEWEPKGDRKSVGKGKSE